MVKWGTKQFLSAALLPFNRNKARQKDELNSNLHTRDVDKTRRSCGAGTPCVGVAEGTNVYDTKMFCEFLRTEFRSSHRKQQSDIGPSKLVSGKESGTKIWHAIFVSTVKSSLYFPWQRVLWKWPHELIPCWLLYDNILTAFLLWDLGVTSVITMWRRALLPSCGGPPTGYVGHCYIPPTYAQQNILKTLTALFL